MSGTAGDADIARRFGGVARLYGQDGADAFAQAHVCVVGIGGVGSWAAEALARSAVGTLTLIDLDMVAESNTNRQIHALGDAYGMAKVDAMRARILAINPGCRVNAVEDFVTEENLVTMLSGCDVVLDAIDQARVKVAMAAYCRRAGQPLVMCGGAGGKSDPSRIRVDDLSRTVQDPLLSRVRAQLRKAHGFPRDLKKRFGIEAVFAEEPVRMPQRCDTDGLDEAGDAGPQGLSCAGYGSGVCMTAPFGFVAAARVLAVLPAAVARRQRATVGA
ncbi:MAG: tRNA threonylcarbamoyladenosine dehydratase [Moraxellaceae bacterium]|nr:tRNA threonylcarbamoyladenosine dehydratase [Moraxellaceae bacterium]